MYRVFRMKKERERSSQKDITMLERERGSSSPLYTRSLRRHDIS